MHNKPLPTFLKIQKMRISRPRIRIRIFRLQRLLWARNRNLDSPSTADERHRCRISEPQNFLGKYIFIQIENFQFFYVYKNLLSKLLIEKKALVGISNLFFIALLFMWDL